MSEEKKITELYTLETHKSDIRLALMTLGVWIDRAEKGGTTDETTLMPFKHAYLRINRWIHKNPDFNPTLALREEQWQEILQKGQTITPSFLPCHNGLTKDRHQPCNTLSSSCRCMELLGCAQEEAVPVS